MPTPTQLAESVNRLRFVWRGLRQVLFLLALLGLAYARAALEDTLATNPA